MTNPTTERLAEILTNYGIEFIDGRLESTHALDFIRGKLGASNVSRADASQMLKTVCQNDESLENAKLLSTICHLFERIKSDEPLSVLMNFVKEVTESFDLKALNGGNDFTFDNPTPVFIQDLDCIQTGYVFIELSVDVGVELDEETEEFFDCLDDTAAIVNVIGDKTNTYTNTDHMETPRHIYNDAASYGKIKLASIKLSEIAEATGRDIKKLAKDVCGDDLINTFKQRLTNTPNLLQSLPLMER